MCCGHQGELQPESERSGPVYTCRVRKETRSQVLGSWNKEARANSSFYRVWEAAVAAMSNCIVRACSALTLSVLLGVCFGYSGAFRCVFILITQDTEVDLHTNPLM